jgi:hypothetical protein
MKLESEPRGLIEQRTSMTIYEWFRVDAAFHMKRESISVWMNELYQRLNRKVSGALWPKPFDMSAGKVDEGEDWWMIKNAG